MKAVSCRAYLPSAYALYDVARTVAACLLTGTALAIVCSGLSFNCNLARYVMSSQNESD